MVERVYGIARRLNNILLTILLTARLFTATFPSLHFEQGTLEIGILLLCGMRLVFLVADTVQGATTLQRAMFPAIVLLGVVAVFSGYQSRLLVKISAGLAEAGILGFAIAVAVSRSKDDTRPLEEQLIDRLQQFVPLPLARFMVTEMLIVRAAVTGLFWRVRVAPGSFSYAENSFFKILPVLLLFTSPPDIFMMNLILRALNLKGWLWSALLTGSDLYLVVWAYGYLVTMRERPHEIAGRYLRVYKGIFGHAAIALDSIEEAAVLPQIKRRGMDGCADLSLRGTSKIEIRLSRPARVVKWFVPERQQISCVTISADDPGALCSAIVHHRSEPLPGT